MPELYTFYYLSLFKKIFKRFPLSWDVWSLTPHPNPNSRILFLWFNKVVTFCVCGMYSYFWPLINSHHSKESFQNQSVIFFHTFVKRRFMCSIHFPMCACPTQKKPICFNVCYDLLIPCYSQTPNLDMRVFIFSILRLYVFNNLFLFLNVLNNSKVICKTCKVL